MVLRRLTLGTRVAVFIAAFLGVLVVGMRAGTWLLGLSPPALPPGYGPVVCVNGTPTCTLTGSSPRYACYRVGFPNSLQTVNLSQITCQNGLPSCNGQAGYDSICTVTLLVGISSSSGQSSTAGTPQVCGACGNGVAEPPEICDDGNLVDGDGCSHLCGIEQYCSATIPCPAGQECVNNRCVLQCGNKKLDSGEECDDGNNVANDGCTSCKIDSVVLCGNGVLNTGEECDDKNTTNGDGCSSSCKLENPALCPNSKIEPGEQCDDGNKIAGDGCGPTCQKEQACTKDSDCLSGFVCKNNFCVMACGDGQLEPQFGEQCDDGNIKNGDGCSDMCKLENPALCPNSKIDPGEQCDDGNKAPADGCDPFCQRELSCTKDADCPYAFECKNNFCVAACGNGLLQSQFAEQCDDGNRTSGDGCSGSCKLENPNLCGNTKIDQGEQCDDGNHAPGDGCSAFCQLEYPCDTDADCFFGMYCKNHFCVLACGNAVLEPKYGEQCDDGNNTAGDGCAADCKIESGGHTACVNAACVNVLGPGINQCGTNADCMKNDHLSCVVVNACSITPGPGSDLCNKGLDCSQMHLACVGLTCQGVPGPGSNTCTANGNECTQLQHVACVGSACTVVNGAGTNTCSTNASCLAWKCGNGILEPQGAEQCDDGNTAAGDGCSSACKLEHIDLCPNNKVDPGEQCDDGNSVDGDGCTQFCQLETSLCGNGVLDPQAGEQCDDNNRTAGDGCSATCKLENVGLCGNSKIDPGEQCDDGNKTNGDGCTQFCQLESSLCGNGVLEPHVGEQCDDNNLTNGDGCSATCKLENINLCPNTKIDPGEQCDDGNKTDGDGCTQFCQLESSLCGNGKLEPIAGEQCDDGNQKNNDGCSSTCKLENPGLCPNTKIDPGEQCDDGNKTDGDGCTQFCQLESGLCGNGTVDVSAGEQCDDRNTKNGDGCSSVCKLENPQLCGNSKIDPGEQCDDGNTLNNDGCSQYCFIENIGGPYCGNKKIDAGEECDDGNKTNGDGCSSLCKLEPNALCGNSKIDAGEECDDGNKTNGDGCSSVCKKESASKCGDGILDAQLGEQCDDKNTTNGDGCSSTCKLESPGLCPNNKIDPGEQCDDGNTTDGDGCTKYCQKETSLCGNGILEPLAGEQCDDKNTASGDGCSSTCKLENPAACGNSKIDAGEQCDDGNKTNGDGCSAFCQKESSMCGDGLLQAGEQCDDRNTTNGDGCSSTCKLENLALCGNGVINSGEQCDDKNTTNGDGCTQFCQLEKQICTKDSDCSVGVCISGTCSAQCGNKKIEAGEQCDDGNRVLGDGCSASCQRECSLNECSTGGESYCQATGGRHCNQLQNGACYECVGEPLYICKGNECGFPEAVKFCGQQNMTCTSAMSTQTCIKCTSLHNAAISCPADGCSVPGAKGFCAALGQTCVSDPSSNQCITCAGGAPIKCIGSECTKGGDAFCGSLGSLCMANPASDICVTCVPPTAKPICGNAIKEGGEECDDGNTVDGDTCSSRCRRTNGQTCSKPEHCDSGVCKNGQCVPCGTAIDELCGLHEECVHGTCVDLCGNGRVDAGEQCDSAGRQDGKCTRDCKLEVAQQCLENNDCGTNNCLDGKCNFCTSNLQCASRSCINGTCVNLCGDGQLQPGEACDKGRLNGVGGTCTADCLLDIQATCSKDGECGSGLCRNGQCTRCSAADQCVSNLCVNQRCIHFCGDGKLDDGEQCDDGNRLSADGCNRYCERELPSQVAADILQSREAGAQGPNQQVAPFSGASELDRRLREERTARVIAGTHPAAGNAGPATLLIVAGGAASGWAWMRRRRRNP